MWKTWITVAVTTGLAAKALRLWIEREEERRAERRAATLAAQQQRWENEGGAVPATGTPAGEASEGGSAPEAARKPRRRVPAARSTRAASSAA